MDEVTNVRLETDEWHQAYADPVEVARRAQILPGKLKRFGILDIADKSIKVLDMCCGHGEALQGMRKLGFTNLEGFDQRIHDPLKSDPEIKSYAGDARNTGLPADSYDWITCIHSTHHLGTPAELRLFVDEMKRILKPGGRFSILDFYPSARTKLAMFLFRQNWFHLTRYMKHYGEQVQEEWDILEPYIYGFEKIRPIFWNNGFEVERCEYDLWHFYLTLRKPA